MPEKTIFERIAAHEIPARIVYEDDRLVAFLDANPNHLGHTLVIPRAPHVDLLSLPDDLVGPFFTLVRDVGAAVREAAGAEGLNVVMNNGAAAGQVVFHLHAHVIPRFANDGGYVGRHQQYASEEEAEQYATKIREAIAARRAA